MLEHNDLFQPALGSSLPGGASGKRSKKENLVSLGEENSQLRQGITFTCPAISAASLYFLLKMHSAMYSVLVQPGAHFPGTKFRGVHKGAGFGSLFHYSFFALIFIT